MSKIDDLINKLCPNGVEYKTIEEIADTLIGLATSVTSNKSTEGIQLLHNSDIKPNEIQVKSIEYVSKDFAQKNKNKIHKLYDIISVHTGDVGTSAVIEEEFVGTIGFTTLITRIKNFNKVNPYYLSHYLNSNIIKQQIHKVSISDRNNLNQKSFNKLLVAVPPLEVQCEIVNILDEFTLLSAELSAELKARQKQYEFYRNSLLKNYDEVEKVFLKDVAEYSKERINASGLNDSNYVGVDNLLQNKMGKTNSSHTPKAGNSTKYSKGDILIGNIRPYLKKIWFADNDGGTNGDVLAIHVKNDKVIPEYLYHILSSDCFFDYDNSNSKGAKMPRGNKDAVMNYKLYLPNIEEQRKIISILGKFETITNDITKGLPAEIEARQKQYEYYRDKLLTFKEIKNE